MKKKTFIISLTILLVLSLVWAVGMVMGKYTSTFSVGKIDFKTTDYQTYTYAVLDNDVNTNTKTALSIRNRQAVIVDGSEIGKTAGTNYLVDKDGTYELGANGVVYALPTGADGICVAENPNTPTGAITGVWTFQKYNDLLAPTDFEKSVTSVVVDDPIKLQGDLQNMFYKFGALTTADLTKADFSAVTGLSGFFDACSSLTTVWFDPNINTAQVKSMKKMFNNCKSLASVNVSGFDTQAVTSMENMFYYCTKLESIDVSNFNTSNVTSMRNMFHNCPKITVLDVSGFYTPQVTDMFEMFKYTDVTVLDLSNFVVSSDTNISYMFDDCKKLVTIYASDSFVANANATDTFRKTRKLVGGNGTKSSSTGDFNGADGSWAVIDGINGQKGYLTGIVQPKMDATLSGVVWDFVKDATGNIVDSAFAVDKDSTIVLKQTDGTFYNGTVVLDNGKGVTETVTVTNGNLSIPAKFMVAKTAFTIKAAEVTAVAEPTCTCGTKCTELNEACEVCKTDYTLCVIKEDTPPEAPAENNPPADEQGEQPGADEEQTTPPDDTAGDVTATEETTPPAEQESTEGDKTTPPADVSTDPAILPSESSEDDEGQQQDQQNEQE